MRHENSKSRNRSWVFRAFVVLWLRDMSDSFRGAFPPAAVWAVAGWVASALAFLALARGLPAETFYVGDPGVKLIAALQAHPDRPLEIPLPMIGGKPVPYVEPFFSVHGDHSHAATSEVFPMASAPFIRLFGIRGAYLLPALGFFISVVACARLAQALNVGRRPVVVMLAAALGTPLLFYGLEFWEHVPAVALATVATMTLISAPTGAASEDRGRALVSGALYGAAMLLRPETICFLIAVVVGSRLLSSPLHSSVLAITLAGVLLAVFPLGLYSLLHFGTIVPPHVASHASLLTEGWFATRGEFLSRWFVPRSLAPGDWWGLALLTMIAVSWLGKAPWPESRAFLTAVAVITVVLGAITAPNDGGGQWGPRYLLFAFVPAAVLLAGFLQATVRPQTMGVLVGMLALAAGVWAQREGYRELRGTKQTYARILEFVRREVPSNGHALTELWWLDQVAASATDERQILFAATPDTTREALGLLAGAGVDSVTLLRSEDESADADDWPRDTCFREVSRNEIPERSLVAIQLRRQCS